MRTHRIKRWGAVLVLLGATVLPAGHGLAATSVDVAGAPDGAVQAAGNAPSQGKSEVKGVPVSPASLKASSAEDLAAAAAAAKGQAMNLPENAQAHASAKAAANAGRGAAAASSGRGAHAASAENAGALAADDDALAADDRNGDLASGLGDEARPPARGTNFDGIVDTGWTPPDTNISVGKLHVVEVVNSSIRSTTKSGAVALPQMTLAALFGFPSSAFIFDPVAVYRGGRHYAVALYRDVATNTSRILLARSNSEDTTLGWCTYSLEANLNNYGVAIAEDWADFPGLGATSNRILVATNQYSFSGNSFLTNMLLELPKASIDACAGFGYNFWFNFGQAGGGLAFAQKPALDYDADGSNTFWLVNYRSGSGSDLNIWRRTISSGVWSNFAVGTAGYSVPPDARQPGTATKIATNDARTLQGAVKWYGKLVVAHNTGLGGCGGSFPVTSNAHVTAINAFVSAAPSVFFDFIYDQGCSFDDYFPAPAWDGNGDMLFGFNRSNTSVYPEARAAGWHSAQGIPASVLINAGTAGAQNFEGRWGDYSGASVDPSSMDYVWFGLEQMQSTNVWKTRIGKVNWKPLPSAL